jgi:hypothetical protein
MYLLGSMLRAPEAARDAPMLEHVMKELVSSVSNGLSRHLPGLTDAELDDNVKNDTYRTGQPQILLTGPEGRRLLYREPLGYNTSDQGLFRGNDLE